MIEYTLGFPCTFFTYCLAGLHFSKFASHVSPCLCVGYCASSIAFVEEGIGKCLHWADGELHIHNSAFYSNNISLCISVPIRNIILHQLEPHIAATAK